MTELLHTPARWPADTIPGNRWDLLLPDDAATWTPTRRVSICIPCRDPDDRFERTLAALSQQTYPADLVEVVIADDSSVRPIEVDPNSLPFPCRIVRQDVDRFGAGLARDLAAHTATGDVLMFLDADVIPARDVLQTYLRWFEVSDIVVPFGFCRFVDLSSLSTPQLVDAVARNDVEVLGTSDQVDDQEWRERTFERTCDLTDEAPDMFRAVVGATIAVSARQYDEIGGFRDVPVHGVEDVEFGYRLQNNGAVLIAERQAKHWHQGERTMSGERVARLFEVRQPYIERLIPVGGFRTAPPTADGPTEVVPQLLVHFTDVATPDDVLRERADRITRHTGTDVEVRFGPLDDGFEAAFAQLAMPSSVGWGADTATIVMDKMIRENVGSLLLVGAATDPVLEVVRTRALRRARADGELDRRRIRRLFGVSKASWAEVGIGPKQPGCRRDAERVGRSAWSFVRRALRRIAR